MANEPSKIIPPIAGGKTAAPVNGPVAAPPIQPVAVAGPANSAPAMFGGHRGGGKKRLDNLPAGSAEAAEADKKKDRDRKTPKSDSKRSAPLPPALPGAGASAPDAGAALVAGSVLVPGAVVGVVLAPAAAPMFVAWSQKFLEKPARLLTKIADRLQVWSLMRHVRKLGLTKAEEKEIETDLKWKDEATADFSAALAECATIELNKRRISGSENAHWVTLGMCSAEMVMVHFQSLDRLEKMLLEKKASLTGELQAATATSPANTAHYAKN